MKMDATSRRVVLLICLAATVGASTWTYWRKERGEVSVVGAAVEPKRVVRQPMAESETVTLPQVNPRSIGLGHPGGMAAMDPFAVKTWQVAMAPPPPPPLPPQVVPPSPTAPPLPFKYMGRHQESSDIASSVFYLSKGRDTYALQVGEKFADTYLLKGIDKGQMLLTYLPLSTTQTLAMGVDP